jgi:hypothetical protein
VAVRSSAEEEDSQTRSYAGQFDTFLDVSGEAQVVEAVKACRASASNPRALSYRVDDASPPTRIPVIVQRMIHPDYAGVTFIEPAGSILVEGVSGLADRLVSGMASPLPLLPNHVRERVERVAREVVERLGAAQDLEWATEGDRIWLLQARPITAPLPAPLPEKFLLWTAANVQKAIPQPLTPLSEQLALVEHLTSLRRRLCICRATAAGRSARAVRERSDLYVLQCDGVHDVGHARLSR